MNIWHTKKLDEVCEVEYGTRVVNKRDGGSKYPVYGGGGATFFMDEYNREDRMVIGRFAMSEKCTRFVKGKFFLNDSGLTISPKNSKEIFQNFLDYQILYLNDVFYSLAKGSAQKNLDVPAFRKLEISYPESLVEQKRIVEILDEVFGGIEKAKENAEKNLKNSQELFESYLQNIFANPGKDWREKTFGEVILEVRTGPFGSALHKSDYVHGGIPVINPQDIVDGKIDSAGKTSISEDTRKRLSQYILKEKDLILARRGEMGRCALVTKKEVGWLCGTGSLLIRLKSEADERFILLVLQSVKVKEELEKVAIGTTMSNLNQGILNALKVAIPPISEQKAIVKKLDALSVETKKLEAIFRRKIAYLDELKKSVLKQAFSGEL